MTDREMLLQSQLEATRAELAQLREVADGLLLRDAMMRGEIATMQAQLARMPVDVQACANVRLLCWHVTTNLGRGWGPDTAAGRFVREIQRHVGVLP